MTPEEEIKYIDAALRLLNIQLCKEIIERFLAVKKLVDEKGGQATMKDVLDIKLKL